MFARDYGGKLQALKTPKLCGAASCGNCMRDGVGVRKKPGEDIRSANLRAHRDWALLGSADPYSNPIVEWDPTSRKLPEKILLCCSKNLISYYHTRGCETRSESPGRMNEFHIKGADKERTVHREGVCTSGKPLFVSPLAQCTENLHRHEVTTANCVELHRRGFAHVEFMFEG